ncbi:MAG: Crp/Fnr family transcriptional regulator [Crocinitomicaceae bacterium]|nr:Crp/Fnr family transcriptional regulator [Crocinitomicaceae bacterium]
MKSFIKQCCSGAWLDLINSSSKQVKIGAKENVFLAGDKAEGIFEIISGKVKVTSKDNLENESLIRLAADSDILGHRGIGGDWVYHVTATALEDTTLLFIPRKTFEILARTNAEFSYKMMTLFAEELKHAEEKTLHLPVINRVANAILMNYTAFGADAKTGELNYTLSRQDFANRAITTYESTVRAIAELKSEKIIDTDNKTIFIKNLKKLQQVASAK